MILSIDDIIDKHKGKNAMVLGHGPSLGKAIPHIERFKKEGHAVFGVNTWYDHYKQKPSYWVVSNTITTPRTITEKIKNYGVPFLHALYIKHPFDPILSHSEIAALGCDYLPFDNVTCERGWSGEKGNDASETIQMKLREYSGYEGDVVSKYGIGSTVVVHAMSFAILMGCKKIYLAGIHIDADTKYYNGKNLPGQAKDWKDPGIRQRIKASFEAMNECAKCAGARIINTLQDPWYGTFEEGDVQK